MPLERMRRPGRHFMGAMRCSTRLACAVLTACAALSGCVGGGQKNTAANPVPADRHPPDTPLTPVLELMTELTQADPLRQDELFQATKEAAELTPTTADRLRLALALSVPGHNGSDDVAAQRQLSELLARPENLLPSERMLATLQLKDVEQRLTLEADSKRARDDASRDAHTDKLTAANRKLAAEMDENARLRKLLDDARAKLEAVTHIERSLNDRTPAGPPPAAPAAPAIGATPPPQ